VATSAAEAQRAEAVVLAEVDRLAEILSGYSATSELSRWLGTFGISVAVSPELADVLEAAEMWRVRTRGAFNPAAASLVQLRDEPLWTVNRVRATARRLTRLPVSLDAIAKGYIVDRAAAHANALDGVSHVLVNIGGDLRHHGARALSVGVTDPRAPAENAPPMAVVRIQDAALATSGGYRRGFVLNGRRVSHIIDPRTGQPAERIASASVFAPDCATADALSTAFSVMEPHESVSLADALPGVGCLLVESDGAVTTNSTWNVAAVAPHHETIHSRY
jgi:thiamine biosynthesis lipoprotein